MSECVDNCSRLRLIYIPSDRSIFLAEIVALFAEEGLPLRLAAALSSADRAGKPMALDLRKRRSLAD